ncbi:hypothetical protein T492DRAFT_836534 [Pavlovales sp. CCMP2436]|nr:hypothetical protein T492DRAFT_836534 [Pavlovales sp. CCMP2436]
MFGFQHVRTVSTWPTRLAYPYGALVRMERKTHNRYTAARMLLTLAAGAGPAQSQPGPPCQCISLCSTADVHDFISRLPPTVDSVASPWGREELPFDMRTLRLLHHSTPEWRAMHPGVFWPMHPCEPAPGHRRPPPPYEVILAQPHPPTCANCTGWLLPLEPARRQDKPPLIAQMPARPDTLRVATWGRKNSSLSLLSWWAYTSDTSRWPDNTWVEVVHFGRYPEGTRGYGQWFHPMRGSDIWVNVGRTFHAASKGEAFSKLVKLWSAFKGLSLPVRTHSELLRESYHIVQVDNGYVPDFVIVSPKTVVTEKGWKAISKRLPMKTRGTLPCRSSAPRIARARMACRCAWRAQVRSARASSRRPLSIATPRRPSPLASSLTAAPNASVGALRC